jgi:hypothetical protein
MDTATDSRETWDRLTLLLIARPIEGWESVYEEITHREVERLAPRPRQEERPAAGLSGRGAKNGTQGKENSAYGRIIPD